MGRWSRASLLLNIARTSTTKPPAAPNFAAFLIKPHKPKIQEFLGGFRSFSAVPSPALSYTDEYDYGGSHDIDQIQTHVLDSNDYDNVKKIPIKAYFLSTSINLKNMQTENLSNIVPPTSRSSKFITLRYCDFPSKITSLEIEENASSWSYIVVFHYGSVVLFNIEDNEAESYLNIVRRYASGLLPEMRKDDYAVKEEPLLVADMQGGPDYIVLKNLDTDAIRIIGSVLGQSIALDHFVSQVDSMVEEFTDINRDMEKTGTFTMERKKLFQLVGKANSNLADVILKVGLFDRSEIAWRNAKYAQIFEYLREEYEVSQRFGNLEFKLKFVEHNIHFLQEVLQNRKSDLLEWCIICLLSIENVISLSEIIRESSAAPL